MTGAPEPTKSRSHKKGAGAGKTKKSAADSAAAATGLLEMVELFAVARFGQTAAFSASERMFIEGPLGRLIEKYGNVADKFGGLIDPVMLAFGATLYGIRLVNMAAPVQAQPAPRRDVPPVPVTPEPASRAGDTPTATEEMFAMVGSMFGQ